MDFPKSFEEQVKTVSRETFDEMAINLFHHQAVNNPTYGVYIGNLGINHSDISTIDEIPFLPISFFKSHIVKTNTWESEQIFESSGTTGMVTSKHHVKSLDNYLKNTERLFENQYGSLQNYHFLALLPSYLERENSSLVKMMNYFIKSSRSKYSGFYLDQTSQLVDVLRRLSKDPSRTTFLVGVTFALLDLVEQYDLDFPNLIVMETGGMKGRREEMIREEVHHTLKEGFGTASIHSEYGMTELLSQAYSFSDGIFKENDRLRIIIRDVNDPLTLLEYGQTGGVNIIDLVNYHTCAFIETQDLGRKLTNDTFEILGRFDNSDVRGCSLLTV